VGTFTQRWLAASSLDHCGTPVPITRDVAVPRPLFTLNEVLGYFHCGRFPKSPWSSLAWLLAYRCSTRCCLRPRGEGFALVFIAPPHGLLSDKKDRLTPTILFFSGLRFRFRASTLHLVELVTLTFPPFEFQSFHYWAVD